MALTDEQRGVRAAWLYHHRVARFGKGDAALEALAEQLRQRAAYRAPDTIKGWESSEERSPIPPDVLPKLEEIFGEPAPTPKRPVTAEDLVAAIDRQTEAITALVGRMDQMLSVQRIQAVELMRAMGALGAGRDHEGTPVAAEHETPVRTGR